jgi:hypothetical protein
MKRALIALPAIVFAFWPIQAQAEPQPGLNAVGYTFEPTGIPQRTDDLYPVCGSEVENNINRNFNGEPFQDCGHRPRRSIHPQQHPTNQHHRTTNDHN